MTFTTTSLEDAASFMRLIDHLIQFERNPAMAKPGMFVGMEDSTPASSTTTNPMDQPDDSMPDSSDIGGKNGWKGMEDGTPNSSAGSGSESGMTGGTRVSD